MIRAALAIWLICSAGSALAQGTIRTGEHGNYTRVVIPIGSDRDYALEGAGPTRRVTLTPPGTFNTGRVFSTLFSGRLAGIESDGDLVLELGCSCDIEAYRFEDGFLVLDIFDLPEGTIPEPTGEEVVSLGTRTARSVIEALPLVPDQLPSEAPAVEAAPPLRSNYRPVQPLDQALLIRSTPLVQELGPLDRPMTSANEIILEEESAPEAEIATSMNEPQMMAETDNMAMPQPMMDNSQSPVMDMREPMQPSQSDTAAIDETVDALAQQLARATAAGLLEPSNIIPPPISETADSTDETMAQGGAPNDPDPGTLPVRAANAFDLAGDGDIASANLQTALSCERPIGDIASWAPEERFDAELGALRQAAFDAQGALLRIPTLALARHYLYHGFGAEAEAWLVQLDNPPSAELAMARYLDGRPGPNFPPVETLALCTGDDMLLRFVDAPSFPELTQSQRQEMRLAFAELPLSLRRLIGPDFVRRLAAAGYAEDAEDVREALARGPTMYETEELLLARETSTTPATRRDAAQLEMSLETAGPDMVRVMRTYLAALRDTGELPEQADIVAAEALLRETEPDRALGTLWHEVLLAHAAAGNSDQMFAMLDEIRGVEDDVREGVYQTMVESMLATDQSALLIVLSTRLAADPGPLALPRNLRIAVFDHLTDLGLASLAEPYRTSARPLEAMSMVDEDNAPSEFSMEGEIAERVAERLQAAQASNAEMLSAEDPDAVRAALDDSRALRAQLSEFLNRVPAN